MCRVSTTFALVSHSRCRAVRPNWAILGGTGSAILRCCNVRRATVTTATRWPNSPRHCPFYALVRHVPAPPTHPMRLGRCRTVCWRTATGPQNVPKAVFSTPKVLRSGEGLHPFEPCSKRGTPPLETPSCPTVLAASVPERVATFFGDFY